MLLVINVSDLVTISFVKLMDWYVIEVGHQCLSLFEFVVLVCPRKVAVLALVRYMLLLNQRWSGIVGVIMVLVVLLEVGVEGLPVVRIVLLRLLGRILVILQPLLHLMLWQLVVLIALDWLICGLALLSCQIYCLVCKFCLMGSLS